jgi:hypothetical protein
MADELYREKKIGTDSRVGQQIADPRRYLYVQAAVREKETALSFAVKINGEPRWYTSDAGINYYKVERDGFFQTTVRLPEGASLDRIERLAVRCDVAGDPRTWEELSRIADAECEMTVFNKAFMLDREYRPGRALEFHPQPVKMRAGEMIELNVAPK